MPEQKHRTITLSGRPPVRIATAEWPILASASGDSYIGQPGPQHDQAISQGEVDTYFIGVREHASGRALIYAVLDAAISAWKAPANGIDWRGGELVDHDSPGNTMADAIVQAIQRVGEESGIPSHLIRECIADLPPDDL